MPKHLFTKGHTRGGRRKGSQGKVYLSLDYWFRHLNAEFPNLTSHQRAKISLEAFKALLNKTTALPQDPSATLPSSDNLAQLIRDLEGSKLNPVDVRKEVETLTGIAIPKIDGAGEAKAVLEPQTKNISTNPNESL